MTAARLRHADQAARLRLRRLVELTRGWQRHRSSGAARHTSGVRPGVTSTPANHL
jgi:hypothetical protein